MWPCVRLDTKTLKDAQRAGRGKAEKTGALQGKMRQ